MTLSRVEFMAPLFSLMLLNLLLCLPCLPAWCYCRERYVALRKLAGSVRIEQMTLSDTALLRAIQKAKLGDLPVEYILSMLSVARDYTSEIFAWTHRYCCCVNKLLAVTRVIHPGRSYDNEIIGIEVHIFIVIILFSDTR